MSFPVLIVGAGPSGLMMAHELARFNIPVKIIDKALTKSTYSRAIAVQIRTLEIFSALGMLNKLISKSESLEAIETYIEGRPPIKIIPVATTSSFWKPLIIDQTHTEEVLEYYVKNLGVHIERGIELIGLQEHENNYFAELKTPTGLVKAGPFSYIIGADGAHSFVRKKMGVSFSGTTYDDAFILADALCSEQNLGDRFEFGSMAQFSPSNRRPVACPRDLDTSRLAEPCVQAARRREGGSLKFESISEEQNHRGVFRIFFKKTDFLAMIPMWGDKHYRLISVRKDERVKIGPEPSIEEFQKIITKLVPFPLKIELVSWLSRFFVQCRNADKYQKGSLFLVGDAAHIHSPAGGQGMNTGLQDAFNLSFKLALVIKNLSPKSLLETYEEERKPVGEFLIKNTDRFFKFMIRGSLLVRLMRLVILPIFARSKKFRTKIFTIGSQTAIKYKSGLICHSDEHDLPPEVILGVRVINWPLIDNHLQKTDMHICAAKNFFTCFIFIPNNCDKNLTKKIYKQSCLFAEKYANFLNLIIIFFNDFNAEKIMAEENYCVLADPVIMPAYDSPFYIITRTDAHVFCAGPISDLDHADQALSSWYNQ